MLFQIAGIGYTPQAIIPNAGKPLKRALRLQLVIPAGTDSYPE
jgi:hypothetical protein